MARPLCLFTGQWADLPLETLAPMAKQMGYDGLELACWGDHFDVQRALREDDYCEKQWALLSANGIACYAISSHLVGQAVCDIIDERHQAILPESIWGDGDPEGVNKRAAQEMKDTARAARRFFDAAPEDVRTQLAKSGKTVVNGFTGSSIWHALYGFPPFTPGMIDRGFEQFAERWKSILDVFEQEDVHFALEVHPTEIAFDVISTRRALQAIDNHPRFCFNFDPSHLGYQGVDYIGFLREFGERVVNVHMKDVWWSEVPTPGGVFGGHASFGSDERFWDFRSMGRGSIDFEGIMRQLNQHNYQGPLTVEWEDPGMHREHGARESAEFCRKLDFEISPVAFDAAFSDE
ncbi:MAG: sugar phosphate isomerase/epimerase [Planctomycetota bacterium]|jgi:sugar phosphate isomerase/epimerase